MARTTGGLRKSSGVTIRRTGSASIKISGRSWSGPVCPEHHLQIQENEMPIFMDRHDMHALSADEVASAHQRDLEMQEQYGVNVMAYWFDNRRHTAFCLIDAPDAATAERLHRESHGNVANAIIPVELAAVE